MPTKRRISLPGGLHHIMSHGISNSDIFLNDEDRGAFLGMLGREIKRAGYLCYAWSLMDNHYHLLLRASDLPLHMPMRKLNGTYAIYFNKKHDRTGYVFQNRFKSIPTQDQGYIEELVRYIHLNPVRAGVCASLEELHSYPWTGHSALMGNRHVAFQNTHDVLKRFGSTVDKARKAYMAFLEHGLSAKAMDESETIRAIRMNNDAAQRSRDTHCWAIGNPEFVRSALEADTQRRLDFVRYRNKGWTLDRLANAIVKQSGGTVDELLSRGRLNDRSKARKAFAYVANKVLHISAKDVADFLGVSIPAISKSLGEGREIAEKLKLLKLIS